MHYQQIRTRSASAAIASWINLVYTLAASLAFVHAGAQAPARPATRVPIVAILPFEMSRDSAGADTTAIEHGIAALLELQLSASGRVRTASRRPATVLARSSRTAAAAAKAARARGASYAVIGDVARVREGVRVMARVVRARDTLTRTLDEFTATLDQIPALVGDLADAVADSILPRADGTRGGPLFRPPRPSVPFAAVSLYSRAVRARAAGDPDTAVKLLREAANLAPGWEQPRLDLLALKPKS